MVQCCLFAFYHPDIHFPKQNSFGINKKKVLNFLQVKYTYSASLFLRFSLSKFVFPNFPPKIIKQVCLNLVKMNEPKFISQEKKIRVFIIFIIVKKKKKYYTLHNK